MNRILITGGRGGIGLSLTETLVGSSENHVVTLGRSAVPESAEIAANVTHRQGSILDESLLSELLKKERITHLIHTAGARTSECASDSKAGFEANVTGADLVFRAAGNSPTVKRLVHFSTAAVYGACEGTPAENSMLAPPTPYAITKATSEISAHGHTETADYSTMVLRPGFVLGPHSKGSLPNFLREALAGKEASLSFPKQFFLHWAPDISRAVSELLGLESLAKWEVIHPPGISVSLSELRLAIEDHCGKAEVPTQINIAPLPNPPFSKNLDQVRFQQLVPDFPVTSLSEMVAQMASTERDSE